MTASTFTPLSLTVGVNAALTWINDSGTAHDVVFDTPGAALGVGAGAGGNFQAPSPSTNQRQFAAAGSYPFHCTIHGSPTSGMRGTAVVQ
jgi:plastocyanin